MAKRKTPASQESPPVATKRGRKERRAEPDSPDDDEGETSTQTQRAPASQTLWSQPALTQSRLQRSGKVLSVRLKNFMCHRNLEVDFNRRTNLVIGANGSGKSAILTALIVGLGSKANATNRSSSIKQFIRNGESSATIEVHLSNDGGDSYEPDRYGDRIVVIRHITGSGTSTYKLQNGNGRTISTSRADLMKMALYMNIQVDNPICVMTQDATRSFLRDSNPKMQYQLFLKATQLDVIIARLNDCVDTLNSSKIKFHSQAQSHEKLVQQQEDIEHKIEQFRSMEPLRNEIRKCKCEIGWRKVVDQEELMSDINTTHASSSQEKAKLEAELQKWSDAGTIREEIKTLGKDIKQLATELADGKRRLSDETAAWRQKNDSVQELERTCKKAEARCNKIKETIQKLDESIQNELSTDKDHIEQVRQENEVRLAELQRKHNDLEATLKSHINDKALFHDANTNYQRQIDALEGQRQKELSTKRNIQQALKDLQSTKESRLQQYGEYMPRLIRDLEEAHKRGRLSKVPVGPFANHIEVTVPKYRQYIEGVIGSLAMAFCCNNANDAIVMRQIIRPYMRAGASRITVLTVEFTDRLYNTAANSVQPNKHALRVIDGIHVDNVMVLNVLLDMCTVDRVMLTDSSEVAEHMTARKENVPRNLLRVIVTHPHAEFYPAPMYRSYSKRLVQTKYLRISGTERENAQKGELVALNKRVEDIAAECGNIRAKMAENQRRIDDRTQTILRTELVFEGCQMEIKEIEANEYRDNVDTAVMAQEIEEQTKLLHQENASYDAIKEQLGDLRSKMDGGTREVTELKQKVRDIEQQMADKQGTKDDLLSKIDQCDKMTSHYQRKIQTIASMLDALSKERAEALDKLNRLEATALKLGARTDVLQTEEQLEAIIRRNERKINAVVTSTETLEALEQQQQEIVQSVEQSAVLLNILKKALQVLKSSIKTRFQCVSTLKNSMKTRISYNFVKIMNLRRCDASLDFNEKDLTLKMEVTPRDKKGEKTVSKLTNLSGGERSYVTVAFLLSLWACVDHPFYFLDEYDVFTDEINRNYMTKLLLREAKVKSSYQYAFLTPQDISEITVAPDLSILRLENPGR